MVECYNYSLNYLNRELVNKVKLRRVVGRLKSNKALGSNKIINRVVKLVISVLEKEFKHLFIAYLEFEYHL